MKRLSFILLVWTASLSLLCAATPTITTLPLGSSAPDFNLPGVDARAYTLKDFARAKALVVIFTCVHCPTAQYYEERVKQLVIDYKDKGVAVVAISPNDPKSVRLDELGWTDLSDSLPEMKIRARDRAYNYPFLYDGDTEKASLTYGPVATPHAFVFDTARKLRYAGAIDDSERIQHVKVHHVRDALDALLADKEPTVTSTKVVGCSVKWAGKEDTVKQVRELIKVLSADGKGIEGVDPKKPIGAYAMLLCWIATYVFAPALRTPAGIHRISSSRMGRRTSRAAAIGPRSVSRVRDSRKSVSSLVAIRASAASYR
jgi:peroxiredoxin